MSRIYRQANLVITYTGPSIHCTAEGVGLASKLRDWLEDHGRLLNEEVTLKKLEQEGLPEMHDPAWAGLRDLFDRVWYQRVWILQECVLSRRDHRVMLCGRHSLPSWSTLTTLFSTIFSHGGPEIVLHLRLRKNDRMSSAAQMLSMRFLDHVNPQSPSRAWSNLLFTSHFLQTSEPKDKIYALLGVVEDQWTLNADYNKPCPTLYKEVAINMLTKGSTIDFIFSISFEATNIGDLGSRLEPCA